MDGSLSARRRFLSLKLDVLINVAMYIAPKNGGIIQRPTPTGGGGDDGGGGRGSSLAAAGDDDDIFSKPFFGRRFSLWLKVGDLDCFCCIETENLRACEELQNVVLDSARLR